MCNLGIAMATILFELQLHETSFAKLFLMAIAEPPVLVADVVCQQHHCDPKRIAVCSC